MLKPLNVFSLGTVMNFKHTNCLILLLTKYLQVEMYFSMSRKQEIMTTTVMRNDIDFLMKELKKSNNNHNRSDSNNSSKKDSMIWTLQAVTIHLEAKTDLHKAGRKIIN
jgi:hypothetical protein